MRVYHIIADEKNWSKSDVRANHRWTLPGIKCPYCKDAWGITGLSYPSIMAPHLKLNKKNGRLPVEFNEFQKILKSVRPLLQPSHIVEPGTEFGPLQGKVIGKVGDFAWVHSWYLLIRDESLQNLKDLVSKVHGSCGLSFHLESENRSTYGNLKLKHWLLGMSANLRGLPNANIAAFLAMACPITNCHQSYFLPCQNTLIFFACGKRQPLF